MRFTDSFYQGDAKALVTINIQRSEKVVDAKGVQKNYFSSQLWKRVERLNDITREYIESDFVREMGRNYVKPPILRTNAILKNKYFRQCLDLWTYLQSYEGSGCGITVEETILDAGPEVPERPVRRGGGPVYAVLPQQRRRKGKFGAA